MIEQVTPPQAWRALGDDPDAVLLDVRSKVEFDYVGHPPGAIHVAWQEAPHWDIDPDFLTKARQRLAEARPGRDLQKDLRIYCLCRSGARSQSAAQALESAGFQHALNVREGFEGERDPEKHRGTVNGWRFHRLPWEQT